MDKDAVAVGEVRVGFLRREDSGSQCRAYLWRAGTIEVEHLRRGAVADRARRQIEQSDTGFVFARAVRALFRGRRAFGVARPERSPWTG
jgi:hypothetical protein